MHVPDVTVCQKSKRDLDIANPLADLARSIEDPDLKPTEASLLMLIAHNTKRTRPRAGCATRQHGAAYHRTDSEQFCGVNPGRKSTTVAQRTEPVPPQPDCLMTDVDSALERQVQFL